MDEDGTSLLVIGYGQMLDRVFRLYALVFCNSAQVAATYSVHRKKFQLMFNASCECKQRIECFVPNENPSTSLTTLMCSEAGGHG